MQIDIQSPKVDLNQSQRDLIEKKVSKLDQFFDHILAADVFVHDNGGTVKEVEIKVSVKNNTLFCKEKEDSIEKAIDSATECMKRSLKKYKEKLKEK